MSTLTRRQAIQRGIAAAAGLSVAETLLAYTGANEALASASKLFAAKPGYGPLQFGPGNALALPKGFRYLRFGRAGSRMSDGLPTPTCHDGTGYFRGRGNTVWIVRNQEGFHPGRAHGPRRAYDRVAQGGVTVSHFNGASGKLLGSALVLNGTDNNCNGGVTPWGSWLSGEENTVGKRQGFEREHGYVFEVPARATSPVDPVPIRAMGRFVHEACPVDPRTGIVYMTEDNGDPGDGFYRYVPDHRGKLHRGGKLQMLAIKGKPGYNTTHDRKVGIEAHLQLGRHRRAGSERRRRVPAGRLHAGPPGRRAPSSWGSKAAPSPRAAAISSPPTVAPPSKGRSGATPRRRGSRAGPRARSTPRRVTRSSTAPTELPSAPAAGSSSARTATARTSTAPTIGFAA